MIDEKVSLNVRKSINDDHGDWEYKYVKIDDSNISIYDNQDTSTPINIFKILDVVLHDDDHIVNLVASSGANNGNNIDSIELDSSISITNNNSENQIILKFKEKLGSSIIWSIEMQSQEMLDFWLKIITVKQAQNSSPPFESESSSKKKSTAYSTYKGSSYYSDNSSSGCSGCFTGTRLKVITSIGFVIYTAILVILFSVLWIYYVHPITSIDEMKTTCLINSHVNWYRKSKGIYDLRIKVTYQVEDGQTLTNNMDQYCYGGLLYCLFIRDDIYPVNTNKTCYYDRDDTSYVYFSIWQMVRYRLTITFGLCGSLLGIWLIWVFVYIYIIYKKLK